MGGEPTGEAVHLRRLAARIAAALREHTHPEAILLTGSAATGAADRHSDVDLIVYYERLPAAAAVDAARASLGAVALQAPPASDTGFMEIYELDGVQCQVVHETVAGWEAEQRAVLVDLDVDSPVQKALDGLFAGLPLHGDALIARWREEARYPDALARAMVERYWRFFPLWHVHERLAVRDAVIWRQQVLVESAYGVLGTLAGLNRRWFTTFQFKRAHAFAGELPLAPPRLADRIDALFTLEPADAVAELEQLVAETQALLEEHMPEVDAALPRGPGSRAQAWTPREG